MKETTNNRRWILWAIGAGMVALLILSIIGIVTVVPTLAQGPGWFGGMMGGQYGSPGAFGGYCGGMYGPSVSPAGSPTTTALTMQETRQALERFLDRYGDPNLEIREIMIFDNGGYAEIVEKDTGIGAMEVLVDPSTKAVYPEMGPNMMWNTRYGTMMGGYGMMGGRPGRGMMGGWWSYGDDSVIARNELTITPQRAVELAQTYLERAGRGDLRADEDADVFYGYYTLHVLAGDEVTGMLSVNGYSGQVWYHWWHGAFIEMSEDEERS